MTCSCFRQKLVVSANQSIEHSLYHLRQDINSSYNCICAAKGLPSPALVNGRLPAAAAALATAAATREQTKQSCLGALAVPGMLQPVTTSVASLATLAGSTPLPADALQLCQQQQPQAETYRQQAVALSCRYLRSVTVGAEDSTAQPLPGIPQPNAAPATACYIAPSASSAAAAVAMFKSPAQLQRQLREAYSGHPSMQSMSKVSTRFNVMHA